MLLRILNIFLFLSCIFFSTYSVASIDKSIHGTIGPGEKLILDPHFFIPHIPYQILCTLKNKSNISIQAKAGPVGTHDLIWNKIMINDKSVKDFSQFILLKPHSHSILNVTGFELNGAATQVSFVIQHIKGQFKSEGNIDAQCSTEVE